MLLDLRAHKHFWNAPLVLLAPDQQQVHITLPLATYIWHFFSQTTTAISNYVGFFTNIYHNLIFQQSVPLTAYLPIHPSIASNQPKLFFSEETFPYFRNVFFLFHMLYKTILKWIRFDLLYPWAWFCCCWIGPVWHEADISYEIAATRVNHGIRDLFT